MRVSGRRRTAVRETASRAQRSLSTLPKGLTFVTLFMRELGHQLMKLRNLDISQLKSNTTVEVGLLSRQNKALFSSNPNRIAHTQLSTAQAARLALADHQEGQL